MNYGWFCLSPLLIGAIDEPTLGSEPIATNRPVFSFEMPPSETVSLSSPRNGQFVIALGLTRIPDSLKVPCAPK